MKILAIETSCDETAVAVVEAHSAGSRQANSDTKSPSFEVLGDTLLSQAMKHREFGGVYPNLAKREHSKNLVPVLLETLKKAGLDEKGQTEIPDKQKVENILEREPELLTSLLEKLPNLQKPKIDIITVTQGPGLEPALWVGLNFAKALSTIWDIPLVPTNHMEGHILSVLLEGKKIDFPSVALLVSGGHTQLVLVQDWLDYEILGETVDDAVGEAFDKAARMLGLPYPGGPEIERLADVAREKKLSSPFVLPRPMKDTKDYNFSYSGLKTSLLYQLKDVGSLSDETKQAICLEFVNAAFEPLVVKTKRAIEEFGAKSIIVAGGVSASPYLRNLVSELGVEQGVSVHIPDRYLSTDNAVMIAVAGFFRAQEHLDSQEAAHGARARGTMPISEAHLG